MSQLVRATRTVAEANSAKSTRVENQEPSALHSSEAPVHVQTLNPAAAFDVHVCVERLRTSLDTYMPNKPRASLRVCMQSRVASHAAYV